MEDYKNKLNKQEQINPSMMRVKFEINAKCFISMLPINGKSRVSEISLSNRSTLIDKDSIASQSHSDPKALVKIGDFSCIDIQKAIKHGKYKILEVLFVIETTQSHKIYEKFTNTFFDKRRAHKLQM